MIVTRALLLLSPLLAASAAGASSFVVVVPSSPVRRPPSSLPRVGRRRTVLPRAAVVGVDGDATTAATARRTTKRTAPSDVSKIFDDFADHFEEKLVETLQYSAPLRVANAVSDRISEIRNGESYQCALDAGCGTGLIGPHLRPLVNGPFVGIDLSKKMAELAAELVVDDGPDPVVPNRMRRCSETARAAVGYPKRLYDGIFLGDLMDVKGTASPLTGYGHDVLQLPESGFDLIVSADVLCYFGEMDGILNEFSGLLAPGGDLVFSTETIAEGDYNWIRLVSDRYAHDEGYVARMAKDAGLELVKQEAFTPRLEMGEKVLGTLHVFHKPMSSP